MVCSLCENCTLYGMYVPAVRYITNSLKQAKLQVWVDTKNGAK